MRTKNLWKAGGIFTFIFLSLVHGWDAQGQGTIVFGNFVSGLVNAPIYDSDGFTKLAGPGFLAQLYVGFSPNSLQRVGEPVPFLSGGVAGYIPTRVLVVPGTPPNSLVYAQVRTWDASFGDSSYEAALDSNGKIGTSKLIQIRTGGGALPPASLVGLESFALMFLPATLSLSRGNTIPPPYVFNGVGNGPQSPILCGETVGAIFWSKVQPDEAGEVTITTAGSTFETVLGVYTGNIVDANGSTASFDKLIQVACNHINCSKPATSEVQFLGQAGERYWVAVAGLNGAIGKVQLNYVLDDPPSVPAPLPTADFNIDGQTDLLLQHPDGSIAFWLMNGPLIRSGFNAPYPRPAGWQIVATGHFDGDCQTDLVLQHSDGSMAFWLMNGTDVRKGILVRNKVPAGWRIVGSGDFNGDSQTDLLLQNTEGLIAFWFMNGTVFTHGLVAPDSRPSAWKIACTGDFDGDGRPDIVLQHADGTVAFWLMNGTGIKAVVPMSNRLQAGWQIVGSKYSNATAQTDIVLQHADGSVAFWVMNGTTFNSGISAYKIDPSWKLLGVR